MVTHHRAMWTAEVGPVPDGMTLDHICHVKRCVNPAHLRVLTVEQNCRRGARDIEDVPVGRCLYGHPAKALVRRYYTTWKGPQRTSTVCLDCRKERRDS